MSEFHPATSEPCTHPPLSAFIAFRGANGGACVWRCSHCGREDVWGIGWSAYAPVECLYCKGSGVEAVVCSDTCRDAFKPNDPVLALEIAFGRAVVGDDSP